MVKRITRCQASDGTIHETEDAVRMRDEFFRWVEFFLSTPVRALHDSEKRAFTKLCMVDAGLDIIPKEIEDEIAELFGYRVVDKRAAFIGLKLTKAVKMFLTTICASPGDIVMYLYVLRSKGVEHNMESIAQYFQGGFPTNSSLSASWDRQKICGANMLDMLDLNECFGGRNEGQI